MPSGSYTDGQTNTVACVSSWTRSGRGSISSTQTTPSLVARSVSTAALVSAPISGVSGEPAHSTTCTLRSKACAAASRWPTPFCRVIRPTKRAYGRSGSTPTRRTAPVPPSARYSSVSMPLRTTCTRSGSRNG